MYKCYEVAPEYTNSPLDLLALASLDNIVITGNNALYGVIPDNYKDIFEKYDVFNNAKIILYMLKRRTGQVWTNKQINGCVQRDWNYIFYPVNDWSDKGIEYLETEYFNTGNEYKCVSDEDPDEIYIYTHEWDPDKIKQELKDALCDEVTIFKFDGYIKTPKYLEV